MYFVKSIYKNFFNTTFIRCNILDENHSYNKEYIIKVYNNVYFYNEGIISSNKGDVKVEKIDIKRLEIINYNKNSFVLLYERNSKMYLLLAKSIFRSVIDNKLCIQHYNFNTRLEDIYEINTIDKIYMLDNNNKEIFKGEEETFKESVDNVCMDRR